MGAPTGLNFRERCRWAIEAGRSARDGDAAAIADLAALEGGPVVDRRLALLACHTSHQGDRVIRALDDPSAMVRALAYALVPYACAGPDAVAGLARAWEVRRDTAMAATLRDRGPTPVLDAHVGWLLRDRKDPRANDLLPLCTEPFVRANLEGALDRPSASFWKRLLRYQPGVLADVLTDAVRASSGAPEADWKARIADAGEALCARAPDGAARLADALLERGVYPAGIPILARHRPGAVLALLRRHGRPLPADLFASSAERMTPGERAAVIAANPAALGAADRLLDRCGAAEGPALYAAWAASSERFPRWGGPLFRFARADDPALDPVFERWSRACRDADGVVARTVLDALPPDLQAREARRHLHEVTELGTRPAVRLPYAEHLPWGEAEAELRRYTGHPTPELRGLAVATLLQVVRRRPHEDLAARALALVTARAFEQDPIRGQMLAALAGWPREVWRAEHLPAVGQILRAALDASDLSRGTAASGLRLLLSVFRLDARWGARWLGTWIGERGEIGDARLGAGLTDEEVDAAAEVLLEIATLWVRTERWPAVTALAASLAGRIDRVPGLLALLAAQVERHGVPVWIVVDLLVLLRERGRPHYDRVLPGFIARNPIGDVWWSPVVHLAQRIPELDPPLVAAMVEHARKGSPGVASAALQLLQQKAWRAFDAAVEELLREDESLVLLPVVQAHLHKRRQDLLDPFLGHRVIRGRFATGTTRWILPFDRNFHRWRADQQQTFARTLAGLLAEPKRDTPALLDALVRLPRLVDADPAHLLALAEDARPVVREKAVRVLGRCDGGQGVSTLVACLGDARARFAIYALRGAVLGMPADRATALLQGAAMHKVTVAKEIVRLLGDVRSDAAFARLLALDAGDLHRDVRVALLRALWDHLGRDASWPIFERAATGADPILAARVGDVPADRLNREIDARLSALLGRVLERPEPEARIELLRRANGLPMRDVGRVFFDRVGDRLAARTIDEQRAAAAALVWRSTDRDGPRVSRSLRGALADRRATAVLVDAIVAGRPRDQAPVAGLARGALEALAGDPRLAPLELRLAAALEPPDGFVAHVRAMSAAGRLHLGVAEDPGWHTLVALLPPTTLPAIWAPLQAERDPLLRLLALRALVADAGHRGWTTEHRARLEALRADPEPAVAGAAQRVDPPREEPSPR